MFTCVIRQLREENKVLGPQLFRETCADLEKPCRIICCSTRSLKNQFLGNQILCFGNESFLKKNTFFFEKSFFQLKIKEAEVLAPWARDFFNDSARNILFASAVLFLLWLLRIKVASSFDIVDEKALTNDSFKLCRRRFQNTLTH